MKILPRSTWTAAPNRRAGRTLLAAEVTAITVHYPAAGNVMLAGQSEAQIARRLRGYRKLHMDPPRNWADIGYNYAIDGAGCVWDLTGLNRGAHAGTAAGNRQSVGVLMIVGNNETPTPAMLEAFRDLRQWIIDRLPKATQVRPHSSWVATACPGKKLRALIEDGALTQEDDDMPTPEDIWNWDGIPIQVPANTPERIAKNPNWTPRSVLATMLRKQAEQGELLEKIMEQLEKQQ